MNITKRDLYVVIVTILLVSGYMVFTLVVKKHTAQQRVKTVKADATTWQAKYESIADHVLDLGEFPCQGLQRELVRHRVAVRSALRGGDYIDAPGEFGPWYDTVNFSGCFETSGIGPFPPWFCCAME